MITIENEKVERGIATADLKIFSACCKDTLKVLAHYDGKMFSEAININTGSVIYIQIQYELVKAWLKYLENENSINK